MRGVALWVWLHSQVKWEARRQGGREGSNSHSIPTRSDILTSDFHVDGAESATQHIVWVSRQWQQ